MKSVFGETIIKKVTHIYEKTYRQTAAGALKGRDTVPRYDACTKEKLFMGLLEDSSIGCDSCGCFFHLDGLFHDTYEKTFVVCGSGRL